MADIITLDEPTRKKLILTKQLYQHALGQASRLFSSASQVMAAVGFDLATETILKTAVAVLDPQRAPADSFDGLIQQVDSLLAGRGASVPDQANIRHVHSVRNDAQHKGKYPGKQEISDCRTYTRDFLSKLCANVWGIDFGELSLIEIIQPTEVKKRLADAEAKLLANDLTGAAQAANEGLTLALMLVDEAMVGRPMHSFARGIVVDVGRETRTDEDLLAAFGRMQETVLYLALGLDYATLREARAIAGQASLMLNDSWHHHGTKTDLTLDEAEFVVSYCVDAVVQIEAAVGGDIRAPFGREHSGW